MSKIAKYVTSPKVGDLINVTSCDKYGGVGLKRGNSCDLIYGWSLLGIVIHLCEIVIIWRI